MTPLAQSERIRRIAATMSVATIVVAVLLAGAGVYVAVDLSALSTALRSAGVELAGTTGAVAHALIVALGLPAMGLILWSLWNAFWLFRAYQSGDVVSVEIGRRIRAMGIALLAFPVVTTLTGMLSSIVVSWGAAEGSGRIVVSVSSESVIMAITGAMLILVGWSMVEATRIAEENRQFV
ncbi:MAG: hypothetical protein IT534_07210 [Bauldia sp.]|jgi:hypothetical protein|nr:hypothetical protein [Bauldia sp.]